MFCCVKENLTSISKQYATCLEQCQTNAGYWMNTRLKTNIYCKPEMQKAATTQMIGTDIKSNNYVPHVRMEQQRHVDNEFIGRKITDRIHELVTLTTLGRLRSEWAVIGKLLYRIRIGHMYNVTRTPLGIYVYGRIPILLRAEDGVWRLTVGPTSLYTCKDT